MKSDTVKHMIRFPTDVYERLRQLAEKDDRSINGEVVAAVRAFVEAHDRKTLADSNPQSDH